jgi:hypothetical protein
VRNEMRRREMDKGDASVVTGKGKDLGVHAVWRRMLPPPEKDQRDEREKSLCGEARSIRRNRDGRAREASGGDGGVFRR